MILSIDPSINNVGWSLKNGERWYWGLIHPEEKETIPVLLADIFVKLERGLIAKGRRIADVTSLVCEYPEFHLGVKGSIAAQKSYTLNLAAVCAGLAGWFIMRGLSPLDIHFYTPIQWKGNINKQVIAHRFARIFGEKNERTTTDHEQESAMLLLYHLSKYE